MTQEQLYELLNDVNHSREKRSYYCQLIINEPDLFPYLLQILFKVDDPQSPKAGWLCDFVCKQDLSLLYPHLDIFTEKMSTVYQDSALRPITKIIEYLTLSYYKQKDPLTRNFLTSTHKERLVEAGFDWMITEQKVAVKAYTMVSLFWLGTEIDWVHSQLYRILEDGYASGSAAYKARSRHTFKAIKRLRRLAADD